jgi:endoglucanase
MRRILTALAAVFALLPTVSWSADDSFAVTARLGRGVNVLGYDPLWKDRSAARFQERHFRVIHEGGFKTIRLNLQAFAHMDKAGRLDPLWLSTLDWVVRSAQAQQLNVIIDEHDYGPCGEDVAACRTMLTAFWRQIAERYKDTPDSVLFEILNEPNGKLTAEAWNGLAKEILAVIRQTNPTRQVVIGPVFWNNINYLDTLKLPEDDRNLIVTVHYYLPMEFTHQGASWVSEYKGLSGVTWGTPAEQARLAADFDKVQAWAKANRRPILLGEFGAYDKSGAELASRVRYTSAVARAAETRGWAWAYWQFDSDFIVYDIKADAWVQPIKAALIP